MAEKISLPMLTRVDAQVEPKTWNEEARTVEVVWTTGATVRRRGFFGGEWDEKLDVTDDAVDLGRLKSGRAPFLAAHSSYALTDVLGVIEDAWILGPNGRKEGRARIRFSQRADVEPVIRDLRDGILSNVSVGYSVSQWERREPANKGEVPLLTAKRWEPMEVSLVPIGADPAAKVRSDERGELFESVIINQQPEPGMTQTASRTGAAGAADPVVDEDLHEQEDAAVAAETEGETPAETETRAAVQTEANVQADPGRNERERCQGILLTARKLEIDVRHAEKLIADGTPLDQARVALIDIKAAAQKETRVRGVSGVNAVVLNDEGAVKRDAMRDALLYRIGHLKEPPAAAREYAYFRLADFARECLELNGVRTRGLSPFQAADLALKPGYARLGGLNTTSDFANILSSTINTTLRQAYQLAPATYRAWARQASASDYRNINRTQLSGAPRLTKVGEHGEYTRGTMVDSKESYRVEKFGKVIGITREVIVNDYLNAFDRIPAAIGMAAASLESDIVYSILLANANMADGVALFHANHGNLAGSNAVISVASMGSAMGAMAIQTDPNLGAPLNVLASYLIVPPAIEPTAMQLVTAVTPNQASGVTPPKMQNLSVVTEARLQTGVTVDATTYSGSATAWFLAAMPGLIDTVEYAYLEGSDGVYTETRNGFDVDGVEVKCRLDFGAKAIDYRGLYKNIGA